MLAHLLAVQTALGALERDVYLVDAVKYDAQGHEAPLVYPYYLVWPSAGAPHADADLDRARDVSFLVGVTSVGETFTSAGVIGRKARAALGEDRFVRLAVPGRSARIRWEAFSTASVDRDVKLVTSGTHPGIWVDLYRVESTPA